jgi:hypothetical protein
VDHPERRRDNPNPKWAVPVQLIEFQPAYAQRGGPPACRTPFFQSLACFLCRPALLPSVQQEAKRSCGLGSRGCFAAAAPTCWCVGHVRCGPPLPAAGAKGVEEGTWQADWQHTQSTKCVHLLGRLREVGAAARRGSGSHPTAKAIVYTQVSPHAAAAAQRRALVLLAPLSCAAAASWLTAFHNGWLCCKWTSVHLAALHFVINVVPPPYVQVPLFSFPHTQQTSTNADLSY